jgi:hypothetical protein
LSFNILYANVQPLLPIQNHLLLMYLSVQASPIVAKVIVPVPVLFQPAFVTVITMSPEVAFMANTLTWPFTPAGSVAVSAAAVLK